MCLRGLRALPLVSLLANCALGQWIEDQKLRRQTDHRKPSDVKRVTVNLDLPPDQRWAFLKDDPAFAHYRDDVIAYISPYVPPKYLPLLSRVVQSMQSTFYRDYAQEMRGLAGALGLTDGEAVLINLIYQISGALENDCPAKNTTGPCPKKGPGLCTGLVANGQGPHDIVWQGRNMDWNFPPKLLAYVLQVEYRKNNATVFTAVQLAGMVGTLHGIRKGGFSVQLNARDGGGKLLPNLLEEILLGGKTPTHAMRRALEDRADYESAEQFLVAERFANPAYVIMAGAGHGQGAIVSHGRQRTDDVWHLYEDSAKDSKRINVQPDWFRLQTNYDHWEAPPSYDDRRTPGVAHAKEFLKNGVDDKTMWKVMTAWPTKNFHTDVTSIMCAQTGFMRTVVWLPPAENLVVV